MGGIWDSVARVNFDHAAVLACVALLAMIWVRLGNLNWLPDNTDIKERFYQLAAAHLQLMEQLELLRQDMKDLRDVVEFTLPRHLDVGDLSHAVKDGLRATEKALDDLRLGVVRAIDANTEAIEAGLEKLGMDLNPHSGVPSLRREEY